MTFIHGFPQKNEDQSSEFGFDGSRVATAVAQPLRRRKKAEALMTNKADKKLLRLVSCC